MWQINLIILFSPHASYALNYWKKYICSNNPISWWFSRLGSYIVIIGLLFIIMHFMRAQNGKEYDIRWNMCSHVRILAKFETIFCILDSE